MNTGLAGKVVIVTGATANIGRGIALAFADEQARVVVSGRDAVAGNAVVAQALERGAEDALWCHADVTSKEQVTELVTSTRDRYGSIDVLVNNVGGNVAVAPFVDSSPETWAGDFELNLMTMFRCIHTVLPHMLEHGSGRIINVGSMSGIIGDRFLSTYSAAKGGVHAFTRVLALELGKFGITVNAVAPFSTRSEDRSVDMSTGSRYHPEHGLMARAVAENPERMKLLARETALKRPHAFPLEIGAATVFLASDQAGFITGQVLQVDGGAALV